MSEVCEVSEIHPHKRQKESLGPSHCAWCRMSEVCMSEVCRVSQNSSTLESKENHLDLLNLRGVRCERHAYQKYVRCQKFVHTRKQK